MQAGSLMHPCEVDGEPASAEFFTGIACDPSRSVVVEACAGSGKTWLLVARAFRLLLAGAQPSELLAITFTRKAAQEMHARLMKLLQEIAFAPEAEACGMLLERGVGHADVDNMLPLARTLYERVLASPRPVSIDTFHGWFSRLIQIAPLGSGVPQGHVLTESTGELRTESHRRFMQRLADPDAEEMRNALRELYEIVGDGNAQKWLDAFLDKRAEWWAACEAGSPIEWLEELCGEDGRRDARLSMWENEALMARIMRIASVLGKGAKPNQARAVRIESAISAGCSEESFALLLTEFCDDDGKVRGNNYSTKALMQAIADHFGGSTDDFGKEFEETAGALLSLHRRSFELKVVQANRALFIAGAAYIDAYQSLKAERRVLDFTDLEWHAYRMLNDLDHAAYLQARLDARYRHLLLDEFQDTNPLQWSVVRAWLDAYGDDAGKPSVFIVGDPKQSIYRFRRADPRVFDAAKEMLRQQGAAMLKTGRTRRNAGAIVDLLNAGMRGNRLYAPQTTCAEAQGAAWRLPLIRTEKAKKEEAAPPGLRDPLTTPREEADDVRRLEEGRAVACALKQAKRLLSSAEAEARWSDMMLLVKKRTHLAAYESALREHGIPFVSDRRGGLLDSLEALDLVALLTFLITPGDDLALAHVLKSPVMNASDDDLIMLARMRGADSWWQRLLVSTTNGSQALARAVRLLQAWLDAAPHLPVHDLLDRIVHEGELLSRYAQTVPAAMRAQTSGNIEAFIELALSLDAGRYPSLPKFVDALRTLQKMERNDAPDEADVDASADAVRILTIHSAKGLEARVVVLLDANHSEPSREDCGILCSWAPDAPAPEHFSAFGRKAECGMARDRLFAQEERLKTQEDWNLLYVAVTRARELLILSGVADGKSAATEGLAEGSWYERLLAAPEQVPDASAEPPAAAPTDTFSLPLFSPPRLPAARETPTMPFSAAVDEGLLLHALLERVTSDSGWPVELPEETVIARWLCCPHETAAIVRKYAVTILSQPQLERFYDRKLHAKAYNELDIVMNGDTVRIDRLVLFEQEAWVLDYKRNLLGSERDAYEKQLARYRKAVKAVFPKHAVMSALIIADGGFVEMT